MSEHTAFNSVQPDQANFYREVAKTLVQQDDYTGMGGHATEDHHGHLHSQLNIGVEGRTIDIRSDESR